MFGNTLHLKGLMMALALLLLGAHVPMMAQCDPNVPSLTVDLSSAVDATFQSPSIQRQGQCCGVVNPDECLEFVITLHPLAQGINFAICDGAVPPGALFYQIDCGPPVAVGAPICLDGPGPHVLTFCKPGNNTNQYCITSIPPPMAGPGIVLNDGCTGTVTSEGFMPGTIQWTSVFPGTAGTYDAFLDCGTCANTLVTGQTEAPPFVDYRICGNAIAPCSSNSYCDTVRVWFNPTLTAVIEPAQPTVCFGAAGTTITVVGGGGTPPYSYVWSTGAITADIFVGPGTYSVVLGDASDCPPTSASVVVSQFAQTIAALPGDDILVCGQQSFVTLNGAVTGASGGLWSGGAGTFSPSPAALNATYTPTPAEIAAGIVQLTLSTTGNGTCPGASAPLTITFADPFPQISLTVTDASCANAADGSIAVLPLTPGWTYSWDGLPQSGPTATGLGAGDYTVLVSDPSGCDTVLSATVTAPAPLSLADLSTTDESCAGAGDGSVSVSVIGGTPPYAYNWSNGADSTVIQVGAGTWTVTVTDANGCAPLVVSGVVVAQGQPNIANAGGDLVGCMNAYPIAVSGTVTNALGGSWSGGSGTLLGAGLSVLYNPSANEVLLGGVDLVLTTTGNGSCPPDMDTVHIALSNSFLNASLTGTAVLCHGGQTGNANFLPATPGLLYAWNDPAGQSTPTIGGLSEGTYTVQVTDALGCDTMMSITITEPDPLVATLGSSAHPSCPNGQDGTAVVAIAGGIPPYSISWSGTATGQTGTSAATLGSGPFAALVTDANGCTTSVEGSLIAPPPLTLTAQVPDTVCVNSPVLLSANASGGTGALTINWAGIGTGSSMMHSFASDQVVSVTVTDAAGCTGPTLSFPLVVRDLSTATLSTLGDSTVCPGGSAVVQASLSGYAGMYTITWPTLGLVGPGPHSVQVLGSQTVPVLVTDACGSTLNGLVVLVLDAPPTVVLPPIIAEGCVPLTVTMPMLNLPGPLTYSWQFGQGGGSTATTPVVTYPVPGTFQVGLTVTTSAGCSASAASPGLVLAHALPNATFTASPWETDIDNATISFTDQSSSGVSIHAWSFGDGSLSNAQNPAHTYQDIGEFPVELWVQDDHGCVDSVIHMIRIKPVYDITVPNVFTPDPDGGGGGGWMPGDLSNDVFYPFTRFVQDFRMRIFNRWGELIFESTEITRGWDGWYRGQLSPQDVYVYQVWVRFVDGKESVRLGDVTLLK